MLHEGLEVQRNLLPLSLALHAGPEEEQIHGHRCPHPDLVHLCYELQGGPAVPVSMPALQRVAEAWRAPGSFEDRMMAAIRAAQAGGPHLWEQIIKARQEQEAYDYERFKLYRAELEKKAESATSEAMRAMRRRHIAEENRYFFGTRFIESCTPISQDP